MRWYNMAHLFFVRGRYRGWSKSVTNKQSPGSGNHHDFKETVVAPNPVSAVRMVKDTIKHRFGYDGTWHMRSTVFDWSVSHELPVLTEEYSVGTQKILYTFPYAQHNRDRATG